MTKQVGLWIDHRKAVIVRLKGQEEEIKLVESNAEKHVRFSGGQQDVSAENQRDRRLAGQLDKYYEEVIACIRDADSIVIFGPGEAKRELEKQMENADLSGRIAGIETVDKLTDRQLAAKVREQFAK